MLLARYTIRYTMYINQKWDHTYLNKTGVIPYVLPAFSTWNYSEPFFHITKWSTLSFSMTTLCRCDLVISSGHFPSDNNVMNRFVYTYVFLCLSLMCFYGCLLDRWGYNHFSSNKILRHGHTLFSPICGDMTQEKSSPFKRIANIGGKIYEVGIVFGNWDRWLLVINVY